MNFVMMSVVQKTMKCCFTKVVTRGGMMDEGKVVEDEDVVKGKPYKYGIKLWTLADRPSGYVRNFRMYTGRGDKWPHETDGTMLSG